MIFLKNVSKIYPPRIVALKNVTLDIGQGEFVSVIGQSGTGKTTFAKLLHAQERPTSGKVVIGGWDISNISNREIPFLRRQVGVIFQDLNLLPKKTIYENVAFALEVVGESGNKIHQIVPSILKLVGLEKIADRYPLQVSGGEKQRAVIARALVHRPKVLIADEPTGNLDTINTREVIEILKKVNELETTIVLITHNRDVVNELGKRVITFKDGEVVNDVKRGKYTLE
ncbi:MAG: ATP-binding cassette domain-containing protein [Parcubacteria group bacterium]|nr:ATP-binding cassette domain-containing protein [Parcubacteria group bacterium]